MGSELTQVYLPDQARILARDVKTLLGRKDFTSLYNSVPWGPHFSLRDTGEDPQKLFDGITGSPLRKEGNKSTPTRKKEYYLGIDPFLTTTAQRVCTLRTLYTQAEEQTKDLNQGELTKDTFMDCVAAFDAKKQASLYLYHALSYPERAGITLTSQQADLRDEALAVAYTDVRRFYQLLLGVPLDSQERDQAATFHALTTREEVSALQPNFFKMQELDHPLVIAASAMQTATAYPDRDTVITMPAGGTQLGIVTQLAYEHMHHHSPQLHFVPYSTHSAKSTYGTGLSDVMLKERLGVVSPKSRVLVVDDNTNSGTTLVGIKDGLEANKVYDIKFAVSELDPTRIAVKSRGVPPGQIMTVANISPDGPLFRTAVDAVPITQHFLPDMQLRQVLPLRDLARTYTPHRLERSGEFTLDSYYAVRNSTAYTAFAEIVASAQRRIGDTYGYRNLYMVANYCFQACQEAGLLRGEIQKEAFLNDFVGARLTYPYLPEEIGKKLDQAQSSTSFERGKGSPWLISGASELVTATLEHTKAYGGKSAIWTKGDSGRIGYGKLIGAREQQARYKVSGLRTTVEQAEADVGESIDFIAQPNKIKAFASMRNGLEPGTWVIVVDDLTANLDEVGDLCKEAQIGYLPIKIGEMPDTRSRILQVSGPTEASRYIKQFPYKALILVDMDGTLLHEDFVREHNPINTYLATKKYQK